jgi:2-oxo-4-hydroxy-4-carboxy-5-ureidoimidazoline decarboxylase
MSSRDAVALLHGCLPVERWIYGVLDARPFGRVDDLLEAARGAAFPFTPAELEAAVAAYHHPVLLPTPRWSRATPSDAYVRQQIESGVATYQSRFGRPFIVRSHGRLPAEILVQLWDRLSHDVESEDRVVAQQLREIALLDLATAIGHRP